MGRVAPTRCVVPALLLGGLAACASPQGRALGNLPWMLAYDRTLDTYSQVDTTRTDVTALVDATGRPATLVSAFFGLDDGMPALGRLVICEDVGGKDGAPIIFSHEVDLATLEPGDFRVTTVSGAVGEITCFTLAPADDPGELRTALMIGQYGSAEDPPATIEVVGNVLSLDGSVNFRGASVAFTALEGGPSLVWAERVPDDDWTLGGRATRLDWGGGDSCPVGTRQVVRATWDGGITRPDGSEVGALEAELYRVTVETADGRRVEVAPFALADLGDGDNNHELCLDVTEPAVSVRFPGGHVTDPADDLNDDTEIAVTPTAAQLARRADAAASPSARPETP
ncbi:MAG: hypothetical protein AAF074_17825 [Pseudomonadota bacterium]